MSALGHSRDACLAPGGQYMVLFDSAKQESELAALHKEERLVKVSKRLCMRRLHIVTQVLHRRPEASTGA